jgi:hypothetical protein
VKAKGRFGGTHSLHIQGLRFNKAINNVEAELFLVLSGVMFS